MERMQAKSSSSLTNNGLCSKCGHAINKTNVSIIDDKFICRACIYGNIEPFSIYPIGVVRNNLKRSKHGFSTLGKEGISRIEIIKSQEGFLYKLEDEKYITVVYYLHQSNSVKTIFKRGLDGKEVGVFASRTPYRLSKIAIQDVKLVEVKGRTIYVEGLDAVDESPVLDIKMKLSALL